MMIILKKQKQKNRFLVKSNFKIDVIPFEINNWNKNSKHNIFIHFCLKKFWNGILIVYYENKYIKK
jgi:hypothetical protein